MDINSPTGRNAFVESRTGLTGLPPDWQTVLETSDISKEEVVQNGSAIVDVLRFHFNGVDNLFDSIPRASLSDHMGDGNSRSFRFIRRDRPPRQRSRLVLSGSEPAAWRGWLQCGVGVCSRE